DVQICKGSAQAGSEDAEDDQDCPQDGEEPTRRCAEVKHSIYRNQIFNNTSTATTTTASGAGLRYQLTPVSCGSFVRPYTSPCNSSAGRGLVSRLTTTVATKQAVQAKIAIQKFWAMVEGN